MEKDKKLKASKNVFGAIMLVLNVIIPLNLVLCADTVLFVIFLTGGFIASCLSYSLVKAPAVIVSQVTGAVLVLLLIPSAFSLACSVLTVPVGIAFLFVKRNKISKGVAVSIGAAAASAVLIGYFLIRTYIAQGQITPTAIVSTYDGFFDIIRASICSSSKVEVAGVVVPLVSVEGADKYLYSMIGIAPGIIFTFLSFVGFFASWFVKKICNLFSCSDSEFKFWRLKPSPITAILFVVSLVLSSLLGGSDAVSFTAVNLTLMLFPLLFMAGLSSAFEYRIINGIRLPRLLRPALLILALFLGTGLFIGACLMFGVYDSIKSALPKRKINNDQG